MDKKFNIVQLVELIEHQIQITRDIARRMEYHYQQFLKQVYILLVAAAVFPLILIAANIALWRWPEIHITLYRINFTISTETTNIVIAAAAVLTFVVMLVDLVRKIVRDKKELKVKTQEQVALTQQIINIISNT